MQNCILKCFKDGKMLDFERFKQKTAKAILNQYKKFYKTNKDSFFFKSYKEADVIKIIATPNGCDEEEILLEVTANEFFKLLEN